MVKMFKLLKAEYHIFWNTHTFIDGDWFISLVEQTLQH